MPLPPSITELIREVTAMDRQTVLDQLVGCQSPRLDFTPEYLARQDTERLRHLLLAARLQARRAQAD